MVGDCVSDEERMALAYIEHEPIHPGDLGIWFMPSLEKGEQYASKWLLEDSSGEFWLACKYFAVRFLVGYHIPIARVVAVVSGDPGTLDAELSARMASEVSDLRASHPKRADLVVFDEPVLDHRVIVAAIDEHRRHWSS